MLLYFKTKTCIQIEHSNIKLIFITYLTGNHENRIHNRKKRVRAKWQSLSTLQLQQQRLLRKSLRCNKEGATGNKNIPQTTTKQH